MLVVCTGAFCICTVQTRKLKCLHNGEKILWGFQPTSLKLPFFPGSETANGMMKLFGIQTWGTQTLQLLPIPLYSELPLLLPLRLQGLICITLMNDPQELQLSSQFVSMKSFCNTSSLHKATPSFSPSLTVSSSENPIALPSLRSNPTKCFTWIQE